MKQEAQDDKIVHLLWTGGWDSTFRLLILLIEQRKKIQPYYIIDPARRSVRMEFLTMRQIKQRLLSDRPEVRDLLLPTIYREVSDIPPCEKINASYQRLNAQKSLGIQYDWLARFVHNENIVNMEMGVLKTFDRIKPYTILINAGTDTFYKIDEKYKETDIYTLFHYFIFPLHGVTKTDIQLMSAEKHFKELMDLTWFCHRPLSNGDPCGVCNPCGYAMEHGFGWRIPYRSRFKYNLRQPFRKGKHFLQTRYPNAYRSVQLIKHNVFGLSR